MKMKTDWEYAKKRADEGGQPRYIRILLAIGNKGFCSSPAP